VKFYVSAFVGVIIKVIIQNARCNNKDSYISVWYITWEYSMSNNTKNTVRFTSYAQYLIFIIAVPVYTFFPFSILFPLFSQICNLSSLGMRSNPTTTLFYTYKYHSPGVPTLHDFHVLLRTYNNSYQKQKKGWVAQLVKTEVRAGWPGFNAWQEKLY